MKTKNVVGFEGLYEVQEDGKIFSVEREVLSGKNYVNKRKYFRKEKPSRIDRYGYLRVTLCKNGKLQTISVHRIVALAFLEGEQKKTVNHKDGNKLNNHYSNLEWASTAENLQHAFRTGLKSAPKNKVGSENKFAKLTDEQVWEIRKSNLSNRKLAPIYGVHHSVIGDVKNRKRYFNVE